MTYIWETYPGILHRDPNKEGCVPSVPKPKKSGVQVGAEGGGDADVQMLKNGQKKIVKQHNLMSIWPIFFVIIAQMFRV